MPLRFRRSLRLFPGVRVNFGKKGASLSLGGRGATVNLSERGTRATVGLPGTGISYSEQVPASRRRSGAGGIIVLFLFLAFLIGSLMG